MITEMKMIKVMMKILKSRFKIEMDYYTECIESYTKKMMNVLMIFVYQGLSRTLTIHRTVV